MKKNWIIFLVISLLIAAFPSCKNKQQQKKDIIIAIIPKVDNAIFDQVKYSALEVAKELGIVVTWEAPTSIDASKQKELIENLIIYKVDGILISCNDAELLKIPISKAIEAGIKVATFDSDAPESERIFYIGTDNYKAGMQCAETMLNLYEKANKKPEQIVVLSASMHANNMTERLKGFHKVFGNENISQVINSFEISEYGKELLTYTLVNNKKINGVQMIWSVPVLNGVDSIPALSSFMAEGGVSVFFDVSRPLLNYIKTHPNCATMKQDFDAMGRDGVINLYNAITNKSYEESILFDVKVIDQTNAEEELNKL
jgi:ribose transport system substrate-binding protein